MLNMTVMLIKNSNTLDTTMPTMVASVNFKKSFIVFGCFRCQPFELTKIHNKVDICPICRKVFLFVTLREA